MPVLLSRFTPGVKLGVDFIDVDFPGVTRDAGVPLLGVLPGVTDFRIFGVAFVTMGVAVLEAGVAGLELRGVADFFISAGVGGLGVDCLGLCVTCMKIIQIALKSNEKCGTDLNKKQ